MKKIIALITAVAALSLGACATDTAEDNTANANTDVAATAQPQASEAKSAPVYAAIPCKDPRPQMCTMDHRPVCASLQNGMQKTFSNGCSACANPEVIEWEQGECPLDASM